MEILQGVVMTVDKLCEGLEGIRLVNVVAGFRVVLAEVDAPDPLFNELELGD